MNDSIAAKLRAIADELEGRGSAAPAQDDPAWVWVRPNGVNATGEIHRWPAPLPGELNPLGYAMRCAQTTNPDTGQPVLSKLQSQTVNPYSHPGNAPSLPVAFDHFFYPEMWWTAQEAADHARADQQWADNAQEMTGSGQAGRDLVQSSQNPRGRNHPWNKTPELPLPPGEVDVPIQDE